MKKRFLIFVVLGILFIFSAEILAQAGLEVGMTKKEVIEILGKKPAWEKGAFNELGQRLELMVFIWGADKVAIKCYFINGRLAGAEQVNIK